MEKHFTDNKPTPIRKQKQLTKILRRDLHHFADKLHYLALNKSVEGYKEVVKENVNAIIEHIIYEYNNELDKYKMKTTQSRESVKN